MKLSMWMIANRLSSLEIETKIDENAPIILKSARRVYATDCVHVYQKKDGVVCNGEGNIIWIKQMDVTQAVEIIQGVFDFYEDWMENLQQLVQKKNYQEVIQKAWIVFCNPMVLFDGNHKVLGISRQYDQEALDEEWSYLCRYGYSSLKAIRQIRDSYIDFDKPGFQEFRFTGSKVLTYSGISYCMYRNELYFGRINLLEIKRKLNPGDYQLLKKLGELLESSLQPQNQEPFFRNNNVFYNILFGKACDEEKLRQQLNYQQWEMQDTYQLALIEISSDETGKINSSHMDILLGTILRQQPGCVLLKRTPYILLFSNTVLSKTAAMMKFLKGLAQDNLLQIGFSLPSRGLRQSSYLYEQSKAALQYGKKRKPGEHFYYFFDYGIEYIIENVPLLRCVRACHPKLWELWELKKNSGDEMFDTLKTYLDHECSIARTAEHMFIHRNTIVYRIKKIKELLNDNLKDAYVRDYLRLSIRVLELTEL